MRSLGKDGQTGPGLVLRAQGEFPWYTVREYTTGEALALEECPRVGLKVRVGIAGGEYYFFSTWLPLEETPPHRV
jgi:hypothetical protein